MSNTDQTTRLLNNIIALTTPQQDKWIAFTAVVSTISLASLDIKAGSQMLGDKPSAFDKALPRRVPIALPQSSYLVETISRSYFRGATSMAFFYLAYKDYRTAELRARRSEEADGSGWRWKALAFCGAAGVVVQSLGPFPALMWDRVYKPGIKSQVQRLGKLTLSKGGILMATAPFCMAAWNAL